MDTWVRSIRKLLPFRGVSSAYDEAMTLQETADGIEALRRDNPWPELPAGVEPFYLSIDSGGRHLVTDAIREHGVTLMLEVGCFLCGSARQWLDASPDLVVIGVDPWEENWSAYVRKGAEEGHPIFAALDDPSGVADTLERYDNYCLALNNIRDERDRFIPVRRRSPEALHYLQGRGIQPQLIYIDALKSDEDLWVAHDLFPDAILCGDDWSWRDETGRFRMREHVERFADEKGFWVEALFGTWVVRQGSPPPPSPGPLVWDADAARALVGEMDGSARDLLRLVTTAAAAGKSVAFGEAASELDLGAEDLLLATQRINEAGAGANRPQVLGLDGHADDATGFAFLPFVLADGLAPLLTPHL
jgi:hypothetical protein